ncbi:LUD domain-containing protein [uncultured Lutibacter sp.]|uniref:LutC/YkgG family protein n=1 Tax=uncultured Lutibacter sp. TaxID=437739 RepID=UPI002638BD46|nr:LUD domain-containing protein [uncultured Lutibacter sp.]
MIGIKKKERTMGREAILKSIKQNKPALLPLHEINLEAFSEEVNLLDTFKSNVELVGGTIQELKKNENLTTEINKRYPKAKKIVGNSQTSDIGTIPISKETEPHQLENIDLAIIKGEFGVAENGAIWISEQDFPIRVLPFITNDLVIVLEKENLCLHLHDAYKKIAGRERSFGLFISGPSKTADIEQCLVIGAQGAMSLTVVLI